MSVFTDGDFLGAHMPLFCIFSLDTSWVITEVLRYRLLSATSLIMSYLAAVKTFAQLSCSAQVPNMVDY